MCAKYFLFAKVVLADWMHLVPGFKVYTWVIPNCAQLFLALTKLSKAISINLKKSNAEPSRTAQYPEPSWPGDWMTLREASGPNSRHPHSVRPSLRLVSALMTILRTYSFDRLRMYRQFSNRRSSPRPRAPAAVANLIWISKIRRITSSPAQFCFFEL